MNKSWPLALLVLASSCSMEPDFVDDDGEGGKDDRGGTPAFYEVNPTHTSASFRRYVRGALAELEASDAEIAALTARSIREGRVQIDELADLTCRDKVRALAEVDSLDELDGYMWQNRIYVSRGQTARKLAATLVHEVNHVINRSEVGYWDDLPTSAFLHEIRAFHAETLFDPKLYRDVDLTDYVIDLYELDRDGISARVLANPITPKLLPDARAWRERAVEDDPVENDEDCPSNP